VCDADSEVDRLVVRLEEIAVYFFRPQRNNLMRGTPTLLQEQDTVADLESPTVHDNADAFAPALHHCTQGDHAGIHQTRNEIKLNYTSQRIEIAPHQLYVSA